MFHEHFGVFLNWKVAWFCSRSCSLSHEHFALFFTANWQVFVESFGNPQNAPRNSKNINFWNKNWFSDALCRNFWSKGKFFNFLSLFLKFASSKSYLQYEVCISLVFFNFMHLKLRFFLSFYLYRFSFSRLGKGIRFSM